MSESKYRHHVVLARDGDDFERHVGSSNALGCAERLANKRVRHGNFGVARVYDMFGVNPYYPVFETRRRAER